MAAHFSSDAQVTRRTLLQNGLAAAAAGCAAEALAAPAPGAPGASVQEYEKVEPQKFAWGWIRWLMNAQIDPAAEMTLGIVHIEAQQSNPLHVHPNSAEYLHVLTGTLEHRLGREWMTLQPGDTLRIPQGVEHSARTKDKACRVLVVYNTGARQMVTVEERK
jgi:quercetin dioxygenase-like cupin family protein